MLHDKLRVFVSRISLPLSVTLSFSIRSRTDELSLFLHGKAIKMARKYDITFHAIKVENDGANFEESLDPYSAFRKASEDSTVPDQPLWGLLVWQVVGIFILGLVLVCK